MATVALTAKMITKTTQTRGPTPKVKAMIQGASTPTTSRVVAMVLELVLAHKGGTGLLAIHSQQLTLSTINNIQVSAYSISKLT